MHRALSSRGSYDSYMERQGGKIVCLRYGFADGRTCMSDPDAGLIAVRFFKGVDIFVLGPFNKN
jgi:hypothetical protein